MVLYSVAITLLSTFLIIYAFNIRQKNNDYVSCIRKQLTAFGISPNGDNKPEDSLGETLDEYSKNRIFLRNVSEG